MSIRKQSSLRKGSVTSQQSQSQSKSHVRRSQDLGNGENDAKVLGFLQFSGVHYSHWEQLLEDEDMDEVCYLMTKEIINSALEKYHLWYMESQLIPFTVQCVHKSWRKLINWSYLEKDPGRITDSWDPDREPNCIPLDDWASNSLANVVFERDSSSSEEKEGTEDLECSIHSAPDRSKSTVVDSEDLGRRSDRISRENFVGKIKWPSSPSRSQFSMRSMASRSILCAPGYSPFAKNVPTYIPPNMFPNNLCAASSISTY